MDKIIQRVFTMEKEFDDPEMEKLWRELGYKNMKKIFPKWKPTYGLVFNPEDIPTKIRKDFLCVTELVSAQLKRGKAWETGNRIQCPQNERENTFCDTCYLKDGYLLGIGLRGIFEEYFCPHIEYIDAYGYKDFLDDFKLRLPEQIEYIDQTAEMHICLKDLYEYECGKWDWNEADYLNCLLDILKTKCSLG